jgi:hypothetical protein
VFGVGIGVRQDLTRFNTRTCPVSAVSGNLRLRDDRSWEADILFRIWPSLSAAGGQLLCDTEWMKQKLQFTGINDSFIGFLGGCADPSSFEPIHSS